MEKMQWNSVVFIFLCIFVSAAKTARILSVFGVPIPSQYYFIEPLLKELAARGHHITSISNYPQPKPLTNFRDVVVEENKHLFHDIKNFSMENIEANYYEVVDAIYNQAFQLCLNIQENPTVRQIIDNEHFDLIILEIFFSESFFGLSEYLNAPMVGVSTFGTMVSIDELVGNISPLSYIPQLMLPLTQMNFKQRLLNVMLYIVEWAHYYYKYMPVQKLIYQRYYPHNKLSFEEAQKNFSLVLLNDHFSLTTPRPYVPNMIEVAGLHIETKPGALEPQLKKILESATQGAILVVFEMIIANQEVELFLQQFKSMKEVILWKTPQTITHLPENVLINSNYSTSSILSHPNIKLYVTHGSFLTIIESVYYGLPLLGINAYERNDDYMDFLKKVGNGLSLKLQSITNKSLSKAFNDVLQNSYYRQVAETLSLRFRDQQNTPMERAVYWIEYVLRHKGASHLRNLGQNLTWWQYYNLDVLLTIVCIFALLICLALVVLKFLLNFTGKIICRIKLKIFKYKKK